MKKAKTYRVIEERSSYSKKKGSYQKRSIIAKNLASVEDAMALYPGVKFVQKGKIWEGRKSALLFPTIIEIH